MLIWRISARHSGQDNSFEFIGAINYWHHACRRLQTIDQFIPHGQAGSLNGVHMRNRYYALKRSHFPLIDISINGAGIIFILKQQTVLLPRNKVWIERPNLVKFGKEKEAQLSMKTLLALALESIRTILLKVS